MARLSAKVLKNVANVNQWDYANQAHTQEGQINEFYVQLVDLNKIPAIDKSAALPDFPLRYMPQYTTSAALEATFDAIDDTEKFTVAGTQPFSDDKSIWKFTLSASQIPKSGNISFKLTLDGVESYFVAQNVIIVDSLNVGAC